MKIEETLLYQALQQRVPLLAAGPSRLLADFDSLREVLEAEGKYIVTVFPEYTPHDWVNHVSSLFALADRLLGQSTYDRLSVAELVLLSFGLAAHDWGMAVSEAELKVLRGDVTDAHDLALLTVEPESAQRQVKLSNEAGVSTEIAWRDYLRITSGLRSGARLRRRLAPISTVFSEAVAKIAEGHTLDILDIRNQDLYPTSMSVFGETVNLAALATYIRIIDLLDIGEDRTPYVLWRFVAPEDRTSRMHWERHRALAPVSVKRSESIRRVLVTGSTSDPDTYAALADLQSWVDSQFGQSIATLRTTAGNYDVDLDSHIEWTIHAVGFEPTKLRFELDRETLLQLLSSELYDQDPLAFVRELLQNSVDAIDARAALLRAEGASLSGEIAVRLVATASGIEIEWSDNGIGMDEDVLQSFFCTVGRSWYQSRDAQRLPGIEAISQFGIGILACFSISDELHIETKRDPSISKTRFGLKITIPSRASHFRVSRVPAMRVGTVVRLRVSRAHERYVTKYSVATALARISRYVRHRISLESDGILSLGGIAATISRRADHKTASDQFVVGVRGETANALASATELVDIAIGDATGDYTGNYQVLLPRNPSQVQTTSEFRVWKLEGKRIDFQEVILRHEEAIFLKGVQAGPVTPHRRRKFDPIDGFDTRILSYTEWPSPTLLLNLARPSLASVNLARSVVHLNSDELIHVIHSEIAKKLAPRVCGGLGNDPAQNALVLGSLGSFGGLSWQALGSLLPSTQIPLLVLSATKGLIWRTIGSLTGSDHLPEVPFELAYAWDNQYKDQPIDMARHFLWAGEDSLVLSLPSRRNPWLPNILNVTRETLRAQGWQPSAIFAVSPPTGELTPLICRKWTRDGGRHPSISSPVGETPVPWGADAPELLHFEAPIDGYAAFGSRYWNRDHRKIQNIIVALQQLRAKLVNHEMSGDAVAIYRYLTSTKFYGYTVPSRISGQTLALSLPNRLLELARKEGIECDCRLEPADFYPGTVGGYSNPYHYPLASWLKSAEFGRRLLTLDAPVDE